MKKFLKISLTCLALLICANSWAGNDDPKQKCKPADVPENTEIEVKIIAVRGNFDGMISIGGYYGIKCKMSENICFIVNGDPAYWLRIDSTGQEFEVLDFHGSQTQGDITTYFYSLQPLN